VLNSLPRLTMPLRCPVCSQTHRWNPADAWIGPARPTHDQTSVACIAVDDEHA
jgi:hypothetical protein